MREKISAPTIRNGLFANRMNPYSLCYFFSLMVLSYQGSIVWGRVQAAIRQT